MYRFAVTILFASMAYAQTDEIARAVKSPTTLTKYLESHRNVDWKAVRKALGLKEDERWVAPCGEESVRGGPECSAEVITVAEPEQALVVVASGTSASVEYLRYLNDTRGGRKFSGEFSANRLQGPSHHELVRSGGKPILEITSNHSQNGIPVQQQLEEWFDLTQPNFEPVFSFTPEGSEGRWGFGVSREIHGFCVFGKGTGRETIDLMLTIQFTGMGFNYDVRYLGIYERPAGAQKFTLRDAYSGWDRRTPMAPQEFAALADPYGDPSNESLLVHALPGLKKLAIEGDAKSKDWLQGILDRAKDTPEKRVLLELLAKH
jgi:hypothetical protein